MMTRATATMNQDLLIEIGTEELPPLALQILSTAMLRGLERQFVEHGIGHGELSAFCSPRRLAVLAVGVEVHQESRSITRRGPSLAAAFTADGLATKAAEGFARSCGVLVDQLERESTEKGDWLLYRRQEIGQSTTQLLPRIIEETLNGLPIGKKMRWGVGNAEFVRPIHWVCLVFGKEPVAAEILGVKAGNVTYGHRFHAPAAVVVSEASLYPTLLREQCFVEPSFENRRSSIREQIERLAKDSGLMADCSPDLLDEVTGLVEWPRAILASFDPSFLSVPAEVLIETMQKNQKYFPLRDQRGSLVEHFIVISNIDSRDEQEVRQGNERVIRPRFSDAQFFYRLDLGQPLTSLLPKLASLVFHEKLGSVAEKCQRVGRLAHEIALLTGMSIDAIDRAALLAKADLVTTMVGEFPALQGTMARYYSDAAGEDPVVSLALEEQYLPRFAGDRLPSGSCGMVLGIADRLDTLVGVFGIGHRPTGAKDPYGLRRASIAVLRMLIALPTDLDLRSLLSFAEAGFDRTVVERDTAPVVLDYMLDRLEGYYQELGISASTLEAVLSTGETVVRRLDLKVRALETFRVIPAGVSLVAANKRIQNILAKCDPTVDTQARPDPRLFCEDAERVLGEAVEVLYKVMPPLLAGNDFSRVLEYLAELRDPVDAFFDQVMVMADALPIRENRVRLLYRLQGLFLFVANFSRLQ